MKLKTFKERESLKLSLILYEYLRYISFGHSILVIQIINTDVIAICSSAVLDTFDYSDSFKCQLSRNCTLILSGDVVRMLGTDSNMLVKNLDTATCSVVKLEPSSFPIDLYYD